LKCFRFTEEDVVKHGIRASVGDFGKAYGPQYNGRFMGWVPTSPFPSFHFIPPHSPPIHPPSPPSISLPHPNSLLIYICSQLLSRGKSGIPMLTPEYVFIIIDSFFIYFLFVFLLFLFLYSFPSPPICCFVFLLIRF
jgi:hypothetical protein